MTELGSGSRKILFDNTISLGHVLTILTLLGTLTGAYATYKTTITDHESRITQLERTVTQQTAIDLQQSDALYSIKQDVAVIRDRMERTK